MIKCSVVVMYPSVTCCPSNINFNCVTDCTETKILTLRNDSSIPVYFKLRWLEESITIKKNFLKLPVSTKPRETSSLYSMRICAFQSNCPLVYEKDEKMTCSDCSCSDNVDSSQLVPSLICKSTRKSFSKRKLI